MSSTIHPLFPHLTTARPSSQYIARTVDFSMLKNQLSLPTWLALGALAQCLLFALPLRRTYAALPTIACLALRILDTFLQAYGWKQNPNMANVIPGLTSAYLPAGSGERTSSAVGQSKICVVILNARSNSPLGIFAPAMGKLAEHFAVLQKTLEENAVQHGFLGASSALATSDGRTTSNTLMNIMYFRSAAHVHAFAHGEMHMRTWNWWLELRKNGGSDMISISHEVFEAEGGRWEAVWENSAPAGLGAVVVDVKDEKTGEVKWGSSLVQAEGAMRSWKGRMATVQRQGGNETEAKVMVED